MIRILYSDFQRKAELYSGHADCKSLLKSFLSDGASAVVLYRLMRLLQTFRLTPLAYIVQWLNKAVNGCLIGIRAEFGPGFVLIHPVGVVINSAVRGGTGVMIESGVVIGDNRGRSPALGNEIFIGSGAKIIGNVTLGDGTKVGANAVVTKDVPAGNLALGVPATNRPL
jgi:serine O-acetyltransferase